MNICFYTDYAISGMTGGIGRVTTVLTDHFRQRFGWKVFSIYAFDPSAECRLTDVDGAVRLRLHDRTGFRRSLRANYPKAARFIQQNHIDTVIIQTSMDVVAPLRRSLDDAGLSHVKVIAVLHYTPGTDEFPIDAHKCWNDIQHGHFSPKDIAKALIAPLYNRWEHLSTIRAYRSAYDRGDAVVVLSESYIPAYCQFAGLSHSSRLLSIPNCVPFEYSMSDAEIEQKQKTCLLVGRMVDYPKRVSLVLQMWQQVEQRPEAEGWQLVIVGDGPDLDTFRRQAQTLELKRCSFEGRQNPIEYYRQASLFLMASSFEGFPMTLVEAQQMGCVPVAFDSFGSLHEVVTDGLNGRIVPEGDSQAYTNAIIELMADTQSRLKSAQCAVRSSRDYSQDNICLRWKDFLTLH